MEPTPQDVAAVQNNLGEQPVAPIEQPVQQPVETPQVTPTPQSTEPYDPFAALMQPAEPVAPTPAQPTEVTPTPQPQQPVEPAQPTAPAQPAPPAYQSSDDYIASVTQGVPKAPDMPDPANVNPDDPEAISKFFGDLFATAEQRFEANYERKMAIRNAEKSAWDDAFDKYGSLRSNKELRDMVHNIRYSNFTRGVAMTPTQAADQLVTALRQQHARGVADNQVISTIESVQPTGGQSTPVATTLDKDAALTAVQTGGETALASILEARINAGQI